MPIAPTAPKPRHSNTWIPSSNADGSDGGAASGDSTQVARQLNPIVEDPEDLFDDLWTAEDANFVNAAVS